MKTYEKISSSAGDKPAFPSLRGRCFIPKNVFPLFNFYQI